jgi:hypothetical protein
MQKGLCQLNLVVEGERKMNKEVIKDNDFIKCSIDDGIIEVSIKYNKKSQLSSRFEMLDKMKEVLRQI